MLIFCQGIDKNNRRPTEFSNTKGRSKSFKQVPHGTGIKQSQVNTQSLPIILSEVSVLSEKGAYCSILRRYTKVVKVRFSMLLNGQGI